MSVMFGDNLLAEVASFFTNCFIFFLSQEVDCPDESLLSHVSLAVKRLHNAMAPCLAWELFCKIL